jgi:hypothetical protein
MHKIKWKYRRKEIIEDIDVQGKIILKILNLKNSVDLVHLAQDGEK